MAKRNSDSMRWRLPQAALAAIFFLVSCGNRANPAAKPQPPPPFEFLGAWGDKGDGPGKLDEPVAFAADSLGNIFFADPGSGFVHKFESSGTPLLSFEDSRVRHAAGIAVDSGGAIYVADAQRGSIHVFFPDGSFFQSWRSAPQRKFSGALGMSVDDQGNLYVPDPAGWRVTKLNNRGRLVKFWVAPKPPEADERPYSIATAGDGSVFVAYSAPGHIAKYASDGSWVTSWSTVDNPAAESNPMTGFAVWGQFVFTMAASSSQIRVWTFNGQHRLDADLAEHLGAASIAAPQLAVTPHSELLVFDPSAPKVFRFRMHLEYKEPL
jgi:streptogramin lyase